MIQNDVRLIGRLTKDVTVEVSRANKKLAKFTLAIDMGKDASGNPKAEFIPVTAWENQANFLEKYSGKGYMIGVQGKLHISSWDDQQTGQRRSRMDVIADSVAILNRPSNNNQQNNNQYQRNTNRSQNGYNQPSWNDNGFDNEFDNGYGITDEMLPF